jgi:hypothetical protein
VATLAAAFFLLSARQSISIPGGEAPKTAWPSLAPDAKAAQTRPVGATQLQPTPGPQDKEAGKGAVFANLPVGKTRSVDFSIDESTRSRLSPREQTDQLRDWLLFTVVGEAGLSADEMNRVLFDVPPVRHGYLRPTANFEYGQTRSCVIGDGRVVAVIPKGGENERKDHLAHIADEHRKNLGQKPQTVLVFEYELQPDKLLGSLTRQADLEGQELFTEAYGYHEATLRGPADLRHFLEKAPDVTHAQMSNRGLVLGGRKLFRKAGYRGLQVEDVAAVWQAQDKLQREKEQVLARFKSEQEEVRSRWQNKLNELNASQRARPRGGLFDPQPTEDVEEMLRRLRESRDFPGRFRMPRERAGLGDSDYQAKVSELQGGYDLEAAALAKRQAQQFAELRLVDHTGFSLDPSYDYPGLAEWYTDKAVPVLQTVAAEKNPPITAREIDAAGRALTGREGEHREVPLLILQDKLKKGDDEWNTLLAATLLEKGLEKFKFQAARYDGDLQGTEVGMVLFYTDLLAKLWTIDYQDSLPRQQIKEFRADTDGENPPLYRAETVKYPGTRIWFGPEERAYQLVHNREGVLFGRRATRIFSASSSDLQPGVEVQTNYASDKVMAWWNDHYEEVAAYEPEYERLNEYIKWSVILSWLQSREQTGSLSFLRDVEVSHKAWFKDWVADHPELRYQHWKQVGFYERGYKGTTTEAMPILRSKSFRDYGEADAEWVVAGGVSGARVKDLEIRPVLPEHLESGRQLSLRGLDIKSLEQGGRTLTTLRGTVHQFEAESPLRASMVATPKQGLPLRGTHGDMAHTPFTRTISHAEGEVRVDVRSGVGELGELTVAAKGNGFKVGFRARDIDAEHALARDVSASKLPPEKMLSGDARVKTLLRGENDTFLVQLRESGKWVKFSLEKTASATIRDGVFSRAGDTSTGSKTYELASIGPDAVVREVGGFRGYLRIEMEPLLDKRPGIPVLARGPPEGAGLPEGTRRVEIVNGTAKFEGRLDPETNTLYFKGTDLPSDLAQSPERLTRVLRDTDTAALGEALKNPESTLRLGSADGIPPGRDPLIAHLEAGHKAEAAREFARDLSGSRRILARDLPLRLQDIDHSLEQGRPVEALREIALAQRVHPGNSELLLRQGLAEVARDRVEDALRLDVAARHPGEAQPFLDGVNRLLKSPELSAPQRQYLRTQARTRAARDLVKQKKTAAEVKQILLNGQAAVEATFKKSPKQQAAKPGDLTDDDVLDVDDSLGLNNSDWSAGSRQKTLQQAIDSAGAELYVLAEPDPAWKVKADKAVAPAGAAPANFSRAWPRSYAVHPLPAPPPQSPAGSATQGDDDDDEVCIPDEEAPDGQKDRTAPSKKCSRVRVFLLKGKGKSKP